MLNEMLKQGLAQGEILISEINKAPLRFDQIKIRGNGVTTFVVSDPAETLGYRKDIQYFATLPKEAAQKMNGSIIDAKMFISQLEPNHSERTEDLMSDRVGKEYDPTYSFRENSFELNVLHGSRNKHAITISQIANDKRNLPNFDFKDENLRVDYQNEISNVINPVLSHNAHDIHNIRIVEDCIATGDTIIGTLATLMHNKKLVEGQSVRVDVNVATTQGLLLLRQFAKQNGVYLQINTGYLAYGLTQGVLNKESKIPKHANYILYPPMEEFAGLQNKQVVADMGNGVQSLPDSYDEMLPHNKYRGFGRDNHGQHSQQVGSLESASYDSNKPMLLVFANGGYGMHAYHQQLRELSRLGNVKKDYNVFVLRASRVWSDDADFGYGVALKNVSPLLINN